MKEIEIEMLKKYGNIEDFREKLRQGYIKVGFGIGENSPLFAFVHPDKIFGKFVVTEYAFGGEKVSDKNYFREKGALSYMEKKDAKLTCTDNLAEVIQSWSKSFNNES